MLRIISAAAAAVCLAFGSAASAATVLDFEDYALGDTLGNPGAWHESEPLHTTHPLIYAKGKIVTGGGDGQFLDLTPTNAGGGYQTLYVQGTRIDNNTFYAGFIKSFDVLMAQGGDVQVNGVNITIGAGEWTTINVDALFDGRSRIRFAKVFGGAFPTFVDNIVFDEVYSAVPEPATWAMLIAGFGMVGATVRARRRSPQPC